MTNTRSHSLRVLRGLGAASGLAGIALVAASAIGATPIVAASTSGSAVPSVAQNQQGDVFVETVGDTPNGGRMEPHLPCNDINLWGMNLFDSGTHSGSYTITWIPPGGDNSVVYNATWHFDASQSDPQVIDVIDVATLTAGLVPQNQNQGNHFKIDFDKDFPTTPQKHKVFWVDCQVTTSTTTVTSTVTSTHTEVSTSTVTATVSGETVTSTATVHDPGTTVTSTVTAPATTVTSTLPATTVTSTVTSTASGGVQPATTSTSSTPQAGVLGVATTPNTGGGGDRAFVLGLALMILGAVLVGATVRLRPSVREA